MFLKKKEKKKKKKQLLNNMRKIKKETDKIDFIEFQLDL